MQFIFPKKNILKTQFFRLKFNKLNLNIFIPKKERFKRVTIKAYLYKIFNNNFIFGKIAATFF